MLGYQELLIIFVLVLLFFGGKKIPEVARGLGKGLKEFKKAKNDITDSINDSVEKKNVEISEVDDSEAAEKTEEKDKNKKTA